MLAYCPREIAPGGSCSVYAACSNPCAQFFHCENGKCCGRDWIC